MGNTIKGSLGFNREQIVAILGSNMYKGDVAETAVKELVQNSFDAIKVAKAEGFTGEGEISVSIDNWRRIITIKDNGCGMTPETVLSAFFTVGGSYKGDNMDNRLKSGGYGVAKVAFLFSAQSVKVDTVKDGKRTVVEATSDEILHDSFDLNVTLTDAPNGTEVTIVFPEYLIDPDGSKTSVSMWNAGHFLEKPMIGDVTIVHNDKRSYKKDVPSEYLFLGTAKADFGELDIYIKPASCSNIQYDVLSSGLYQFTRTVWSDNSSSGMGLGVIVNIKPYVDIKSRIYPINNQRQGFRDTCSNEVRDLENLLKEIHNAYTKGRYAASFASCISLDVRELSHSKRIPYAGEILEETVTSVKEALGVLTPEEFSNVLSVIHTVMSNRSNGSSLDTSGINLPKAVMVDTSRFDLDKPVFHNNTTMQLDEDASVFLKEFGALLLEVKDLYLQTYNGVIRHVSRWDEVIASEVMSRQYWGISFDKEYLGIKVNPKLFNFIGINPFGHKLPTYKGVNPSAILTECLIHTIIHELNHNFASGEGSTFTSNLVITEAEFVGIGELYEKWKKSLYTLVENNLDLIVKYHKMYEEASNKGDSLRE